MGQPDRIRAFLALEMPDSVREIIRREQTGLKVRMPKARWTRPEGQHLTLKFLGETTADQLTRLKGELATRTADLAAVRVHLEGSGFFPSPRRPRVAWIGGRADGGAEAAVAVDAAAVKVGFAPERRGWSLHLTQARIDRPWPRRAVEAFLDWGRSLEFEPFICREVVLFESDLRPGGAVYTPLERFLLK